MCVELLFLPSVYTPCPTCKGARYNAKTLEIKMRGKSIADVLGMTVDAAFEFFGEDEALRRSLDVLREGGTWVHPTRPIGDPVVRRRSPTHQTRNGTTALATRRNTLRTRRADDGPASV